MRWAEHVARIGEGRRRKERLRSLVGKPEGKRPLGRPRHRWVDNIEMHLREIEWRILTGLVWLRIGTREELL
jgi:hypothetical protein